MSVSTTIHILALVAKEGADKFFATGLELAKVLKLPVTSWRVGDPTRSLYKYLAEVFDALEDSIISYAAASNLTTAEEGDWLDLHALDTFNVEVTDSSYATPSVTLTNTGAGVYPIAIGDLTVKAGSINKTYHNTALGRDDSDVEQEVLGPGMTLTFLLEADEPGASSSVAEDEIDSIVTARDGVVIVSSTAATAADKLSADEIKELCRDSNGALSPMGPADAFNYICRTAKYTGSTEITRAWSTNDSTTGDVATYVAGALGSVSPAAVSAAQTAVQQWAEPLCMGCVVSSAINKQIEVVATVHGDDLPSDFSTRVQGKLQELYRSFKGGGVVPRSKMIAAFHAASAALESVTLTTPAADVELEIDEVPVNGPQTISQV